MSKKGGEFEREISKTLSLWWTKGLGRKPRDDVFWRTAGSGARATVRTKRNSRTKGQYGDLCATDTIGVPFIDVFTTELKNGYSSHTIAHMLDAPKTAKTPQHEAWITKLDQSHQAAGSVGWLLIHKRTRRNAIAFMPVSLASDLGLLRLPILSIQLEHDIGGIFGLPFYIFLDFVKPVRIVEISRS